MLRIKLVKSPIGNTKRNRSIVQALGLRKMQHTVDHRDTPQIRGMVHKVKHMLEVTEISESEAKPRTTGAPSYGRTSAPTPGMKRRKKAKAKRARPMPAPKVKRAKSVERKAKSVEVAPKAKAATPKAEAKPKAAAKPKAEKAEAKPKAEKKPRAKKEEK